MSFFAVFAVSSLDGWFKFPWPSYFNRCRC